MTLPYSSSSTGDRAIQDIQKTLRHFGCSKFGTGYDWETNELFVQFEAQGRMIIVKASAQGYAAAWLKENPWSTRRKSTALQHKRKALEIGETAVYSMLRDWIKGQVTAIEIGMMTFDSAFLSHVILPSGKSVYEEITSQKLLPAPDDPS